MTEAEWLACATSEQLIDYLRLHRKTSQRKAMLFAVAAFERLHYILLEPRHREGIAHLADCAEGRAATDESRRIVSGVRHNLPAMPECREPGTVDEHYVALMLYRALVSRDCVSHAILATAGTADGNYELLVQSQLLRDIFGNPFRPAVCDSAWRTATVVSLATAIYDDRAFDRLPILADALEDAGCTNADMLKHCREPGEHVRGCWCVDLLLGKS